MPSARAGLLAAARRADPPTDADLLARFAAARDAEAFAELVRRHGPAVLAACRRVTRHADDADDAFQAAFLVLARGPHRVRTGEPLGAWLYGVAVRTARKAAGRPHRRREVTGMVPDVPARATEPFDPDAARAVVEEVGRLSAKYRAAVVLCELEGRPRTAAARELGIAEGTLSSRLAAARKELADRLAARGLGPAALAALVGVAVPPELSARTAALAADPAPAAVASLAHGVTRAMTLRRLLLPAAGLGLLTAGLTAAALAAPAAQDPPPAAKAEPPAAKADAPAPAAKDFDALVVKYNPGGLSPYLPATLTFTPDGKCVYEIVGYPPRGTIPALPAAKKVHTLSADRARRLTELLKASDWLARPVEPQPLMLHQADYAVTLRRAGAARSHTFHGEEGNYRDLLVLVRGVAAQEFLAYCLEDVPYRQAYARFELETYVRAELGQPQSKSVDPIDFARFGGWASRVLRDPAGRRADDVATAALLAGFLRLASEREALAALARHDSFEVRAAVQFALGRIPEPR